MTSSNDSQVQRLRDLVDNIAKDVRLLKEFEDELRYASDHRSIARLKRDIARQKDEIAQHQKEYQREFSSLSKDLRDKLNKEQRAKIDALFQELEQQVRSLQELRKKPAFSERSRTERALLKQVAGETYRRLNKSLHNQIFITIDKKYQNKLVKPIGDREVQLANKTKRIIESNTPIAKVFF